MKRRLRQVAQDWLPPALYKRVAVAVHRRRGDTLVFSGRYPAWADAEAACAGYADPEILARTITAMTEVMAGRATFERDGTLLPEPEYSFPALAALLWAGGQDGGALDVIDFGGALGSSYFQFRPFLSHLRLRWAVVEQEHFVEAGRTCVVAPGLTFHSSLAGAIAATRASLCFASSVIQYLPSPAAFCTELLGCKFDYLLFDRTSFHRGDGDRLTRQQNPREFYSASYPAWFLHESSFRQRFEGSYELVYAFDGRDQVWLDDGDPYYRGFLFRRRP